MHTFRKFLESVESVVAYHGTRGKFSRLEPRPARYGTGISLTQSKEVARRYGEGEFKGGRREGEVRVIKAEVLGDLFDFTAPVDKEKVASSFETILDRYRDEFTPEKFEQVQRDMVTWSSDGESFWRGLVRSFSKRGTDRECRLAKSRNLDRKSCEAVIDSKEMPDIINDVLSSIGYSGISYLDTNAGITHRCYLIFSPEDVHQMEDN